MAAWRAVELGDSGSTAHVGRDDARCRSRQASGADRRPGSGRPQQDQPSERFKSSVDVVSVVGGRAGPKGPVRA